MQDVKAENVVLHGERAVLIDFGIAAGAEASVGLRGRLDQSKAQVRFLGRS